MSDHAKREHARQLAAAMDEDVLAFWRAMPKEWVSVSALVEMTGRPQSTVSTWLKRLVDAGAVDRRKARTQRLYLPYPRLSLWVEVERGASTIEADGHRAGCDCRHCRMERTIEEVEG